MYTESVIVHLAECLAEHRSQRHEAGRTGRSLWTLLTHLAAWAIDSRVAAESALRGRTQ